MTARRMLRRNCNGERGAVLIFAAVGMVVALMAAAMAVDVGSVIWRKRDLQVVADLAATDTAQQLAVTTVPITQALAQDLAEETATRNNFNFAAPNSLRADLVELDAAGEYVVAADPATATAVLVTARRQVSHTFAPGSNTVTVDAVASFAEEPTAAFSIGSELANVNTSPPTVLNRVLSEFFNATTDLNTSLLSYKGLSAATVSLGEIATADSTLGSPEQLFGGDVNVRRLITATASALNSKGDPASVQAATTLASIASKVDASLLVDLAELITVQQPGGSAAAQAQFNVFDLLTGTAMIADSDNFISVDGLTLGDPRLVSSTLDITVIEAPQFAAGPVRFDSAAGQWVTRARTAQLRVELDTRIVADTGCLLGLLGLCVGPPALAVDLSLPIIIEGAQATGSLTGIRCASPLDTSEIDILADTVGGSATADAVLAVKLAGTSLLTLPPIINADVPLVGGSATLTFPGPHDGSDVRSTGSTGLGLGTLLAADIQLLGAVPLGFLGLVQPVTTLIDQQILDPIFEALGVSLSRADVRTHAVECDGGTSRLVR